MNSFRVGYRFDLHEAHQAMLPHVQRLIRETPKAEIAQKAKQFFHIARHATPWRALRTFRPAEDTVEQQIFLAWVLYFLQRQCYLTLKPYLEELWQPLFVYDHAFFLNEARGICERMLYPLYWACSPSNLSLHEQLHSHSVNLKFQGTLLTLSFDCEVEPGVIPERAFHRPE